MQRQFFLSCAACFPAYGPKRSTRCEAREFLIGRQNAEMRFSRDVTAPRCVKKKAGAWKL